MSDLEVICFRPDISGVGIGSAGGFSSFFTATTPGIDALAIFPRPRLFALASALAVDVAGTTSSTS